MTGKPLLNALSATLYISAVASIMYYLPKVIEPVESIIVPIALLSLFVLSAAVMGYIFCFQPIKQYIDGKKEESVKLFLMTLGYFAITTLGIFCLLLLISLVTTG